MATIGNLAVVLSANAAPFISGLRMAASVASSTASQIGNTLAGVAKSAAAVGGIGGVLSGGGLFAAVQSGLGRLEKLDQEARRLGVTVKDLDTLMLAAGASGEAMAAGIGSLQMKIAAAAGGNLDGLRSFERLSELSGGGLSAAGLAGQGMTQTLADVATRLARVGNEATRAALAYDLFGDKAGELLPLLSRGGAGIDAAADKMKRFGLGANAGELQAVREVTAAQRDLKSIGTGLINQVTLGVAPIAAEISKWFKDVNVDFSGLKTTVMDAVEFIGKMGVFAIEAWKDPTLIKDAWDTLFAYLKAGVHALVGEMAAALGKLPKLLMEQVQGGTLDSIMEKLSGASWLAGGPLTPLGMALGGTGQMWNWLTGTESGVAGRGSFSKGLEKDKTALAEAQALWAQMQAKLNKTDGMQKWESLMARARASVKDVGETAKRSNPIAFWQQSLGQFQQAVGGMKPPLEGFGEQMRQIGEWQRLNFFAGQGGGLMQRMAADAFGKLNSAVQLPQLLSPSAALANTREAYSAAVQYNRRDQTLTVAEQMRALQQEANRQQAEQIRIGNEVLRELRQGAAVLKVRK